MKEEKSRDEWAHSDKDLLSLVSVLDLENALLQRRKQCNSITEGCWVLVVHVVAYGTGVEHLPRDLIIKTTLHSQLNI